MTWKIIDDTSTEHTLESLGLVDATLTINNLAADRAILTFSGAAPAIFAAGKKFRITEGANTRFLGECKAPDAAQQASQSTVTVDAYGYFDTFERAVFMQQVTYVDGTSPLFNTNCTLSGTIKSMCAAIITGALNTLTGPGTLAIGYNDMPETNIPVLKFTDATFAEVIKKVMSYAPGSQLVFTYDGTKTIANFLQRTSANLTALTLPSTVISKSEALVYPDKVTRVYLIYDQHFQKVDTSGNIIEEGTKRMSEDRFPVAGGWGKDVLILTKTLSGTKKTIRDRFTFATSYGYLNDYIGVWDGKWEYYKVGELLNGFGAGYPQISWGGPTSYAPSGCSYCISVSIGSWVRVNTNLWPDSEPAYNWCEIIPTTITASFASVLRPPSRFYLNNVVGIWRGTLTATFYAGSGDPNQTVSREIWVASKGGGTISGVNLDILTDGSSDDIEEAPTAGAAQMLYTSLQTGYHDAAIRITKADSYSLFARKYNTTSTPVQQITYNLSLGEAAVRTGPPVHLRPSDFLQLRNLNQ